MIAGKQLGKKAMLFGAIANNLPDIDVASNLWASDTRALLLHRGITHSFFACVIFAFILAYVFRRYCLKYNIPYSKWLLLFGSGLALHLFTDSLTSYGTGWFEPFSHARISFNTIFILDPLFSLPLMISAIAVLFMKPMAPKSFTWCKYGVIISFIYLSFTIINKLYINSVVTKNLRDQNIAYSDYLATPTPLNNFLWYIVVKQNAGFDVGYYSIFDKDKNISFYHFAKNDSLINFSCDTVALKDLLRFTQGYCCFRMENDTVILSDMRFGQAGGWSNPNAPFVFNFKLAANCYNKEALQKGRFEAFSKGAVRQLFRRMFGNKP